MLSPRFKYLSMMIAIVVSLVACGGGGTQLAGGGIGGTGVSQGPITGYGSIFVNGVEFDTNSATIVKDGSSIGPLSTDELKKYLKIGMIVTVDGNIASSTAGTASSVSYAKELEGPITAMTADTFTVLGQTVIVDNLTKIETTGGTSGAFTDLNVGDVVEVSGYPTVDGIRATYIEAKASGTTTVYELKGTISSISGTMLTIGAQAVDINGASFNFTPKAGDYIEVKGVIVGVTLVASSIELKTRTLKTENASKAELQGYVTSVTSATAFILNAQPVQTNALTKYSGGAAADIKVGVILEIEGSLVNGTLIAAKISFEDDLELEGNVASIDTSTNILTLDSYPTIRISLNDALTELEGISSFSAISAGDHIRIRGRMIDGANCSAGQCVLATQLSFEIASAASSGGSGGSSSSGSGGGSSGSGNSTELQGPVDSIVPGVSITVLGVTVDTTSITIFNGDGVTDSVSFYDKLEVGDLVDISGTQVNGSLVWESIELEN